MDFLFLGIHIWPAQQNRVVYTLLSSFAVGILCMLSVLSGIAVHVDKVMIGNIMLQIPGINMMNAIRDMMCGDMITGLLRLMEAIILAVAIAAGFALAIICFANKEIISGKYDMGISYQELQSDCEWSHRNTGILPVFQNPQG